LIALGRIDASEADSVLLIDDQNSNRVAVCNLDDFAGERCCKRWQRREYRDEE
jgi:hypothetical protein